jgi:serine/threonine-protein kinase
VKIMSMACEGLAFAHEFCDPQTGVPLRLIHCDVSPENILLSRNGTVKVVDFGIAKAAGVSPQTKVGTFKGKVSYMPPERIQGNPIDLRADIFSLGVVLYELLTGVKPFNAKTEVSILHAILQEPIVPVLNRRPDVPDQLSRILLRSLAKDPDNRYRSCREFQHDLERFLVGIGKSVSSYHLARLVAYATDSAAANASGKHQVPAKIPPGIPPVVPAPMPSTPQPEIKAAPPPNPGPESSIVYEQTAISSLDLPRGSRAPAYIAAIAMLLAGVVAVYALIQRQRIAPPPVKVAPPATARTQAPKPPEAVGPPVEPTPTPTDTQGQAAEKPQELTSLVSSTDPVPSPPPSAAEPRPADRAPAEEPSEPASERRNSAPARSVASFGVESRPRGLVRVNGKLVGLSPVRIQNHPPGSIQVEVSNPEKAFLKQQTFELNAGDNGTKVVLVEKGTLEFNIHPSAMVLLDGKRLGQTPLPPIQAYEGKHSIRLVNREIKKEVSVDFTVKPGRTNIFKYNLSD